LARDLVELLERRFDKIRLVDLADGTLAAFDVSCRPAVARPRVAADSKRKAIDCEKVAIDGAAGAIAHGNQPWRHQFSILGILHRPAARELERARTNAMRLLVSVATAAEAAAALAGGADIID